MNRISEDVKVRMYVGPAIMYALNTGFTIILVISIMLSVSPKLTLFDACPTPIAGFFNLQGCQLDQYKITCSSRAIEYSKYLFARKFLWNA